jgi:alginate O-acetyltransferase complex protein AlgI
LHVVLPVGISFYTFQSMGYVIDVYRRTSAPVEKLFDFAVYVAFFPQLVAGPIERAMHMVPQLTRRRVITANHVHEGLQLVLWGFFKKLVVADNLAAIADPIFAAPQVTAGVDLLIGALAFTGQIYGDFSGYTDIARGVARLLGVELMVNFRLPYFARNPRDFWARWHISLSTWLRDYLYVSLGGNRAGPGRTLVNLVVTMLLGGLWHGAQWTFVMWGLFHGSWLVLHRVATGAHDRAPRSVLTHAAAIAGTFALTVVGWVIFRARSGEDVAWILTHWGVGTSTLSGLLAWKLLVFWLPLVIVDAAQAWRGDLLLLCKLSLAPRALVYASLFCGVLAFGSRAGREFIYFQF